MKIAFVGDIHLEPPTPDIRLGSRLAALLESVDYRVANLECPVTSRAAPILKTGRCFRCDAELLAVLESLRIDAVTLANNHILDHGSGGLEDTLSALDEAGVRHVGAGAEHAEARQPLEVRVGSRSAMVLNYAEHEWSVAGVGTAGASGYDVLQIASDVTSLRGECDHIIVVVHGGVEHVPFPTPRMVREFRHFVDCGADAVVAHHSHIAGVWETYRGRPILYGLGNFIAQSTRSDEHLAFGLVARVGFSADAEPTLEIDVSEFNDEERLVELAEERKSESLLQSLRQMSQSLTDPVMLQHRWKGFAMGRRTEVLGSLHWLNRPRTRLLFRILRRLALLGRWSTPADHMNLLNRVRCESHRDLLLTVLEEEVRAGHENV